MVTLQIPALPMPQAGYAGMTLFEISKVKDLLCLPVCRTGRLLQQEEDSLIKFIINSGIPFARNGCDDAIS